MSKSLNRNGGEDVVLLCQILQFSEFSIELL